jgi:hypothetical protein
MLKKWLTTVSVACVSGMLITGCSSLSFSGEQSPQAAANSAISGRGSVQVIVVDGVAAVYGWVDDAISEGAVLRAVENADGVTRVVDKLQRQM